MQLSVPVTHTLDLSTDHPGYDLVREEAYRGFYEPPLADSLRGAAVATGGSGFRCAPAVAAARADSLMHVRRYYAVAGARATAGHLHPRMHELHAQLLGAAAAAAKAVRHRYPGVSVDAVEVFQAALAAQCKGLLDGALPGVVAALGLLEGSRGGWVLSAEGGVDEKLQAASEVRPSGLAYTLTAPRACLQCLPCMLLPSLGIQCRCPGASTANVRESAYEWLHTAMQCCMMLYSGRASAEVFCHNGSFAWLRECGVGCPAVAVPARCMSCTHRCAGAATKV